MGRQQVNIKCEHEETDSTFPRSKVKRANLGMAPQSAQSASTHSKEGAKNAELCQFRSAKLVTARLPVPTSDAGLQSAPKPQTKTKVRKKQWLKAEVAETYRMTTMPR